MSPFLKIEDRYLNRDLITSVYFSGDVATVWFADGQFSEFEGRETKALRAYVDADAIDLRAPKAEAPAATKPTEGRKASFVWVTSACFHSMYLAEKGGKHFIRLDPRDPAVLRFESEDAAKAWLHGLPDDERGLIDGLHCFLFLMPEPTPNPQGPTP